ncbi:endolytic transglycosylase MltG [Orbus mooreae]|uniref:endolytic transglycosylase MltG n=1 Tax=Orbus mooreae TaxID=3074107 RepID=UPI00370D42B1
MKKKSLIYFIVTCSLLVVIALGIGYWYIQNFAQKTIHLSTPEQTFVLKRGTSVASLAKQMEQEELIADASLLPYLMKINPELQGIKAGTYSLATDMTVEQFLQLLVGGKEVQLTVQFVEGKTAKDWLKILQEAPNISSTLMDLTLDEIAQKLNIDGSLEGWLYPDTYNYTNGTSDLAILERAHQKMKTTLQAIWDNRDDDLPYETPYEMLIMASIIEKETGVDAERAKVASVFINRLRYKMLLQTDPTVIYGMGERYTGKLLSKDLRDATNPYNTYIIKRFPPTPIAMPSLASLEAAAHPDKTNYIYFVADAQGGHVFTTNYKAHQKAVSEYWRLIREKQQ